LAAALAYQADEQSDPTCLYHHLLLFWQMRDRQQGRAGRGHTTYTADLVGCYLLGRQDAAQMRDELDEDRPSGALALVAGMVDGALLVLGLLGVGVVLGFVRFGGW
jgi:hypothetical protein